MLGKLGETVAAMLIDVGDLVRPHGEIALDQVHGRVIILKRTWRAQRGFVGDHIFYLSSVGSAIMVDTVNVVRRPCTLYYRIRVSIKRGTYLRLRFYRPRQGMKLFFQCLQSDS